MNKGIIFDLDGTLWDSSEQVSQAWNIVLDACDDVSVHMTAAKLRTLMGMTLNNIARILFAGVPEQRALEIIRKCCTQEQEYLQEHGGCVYSGLKETLSVLSEKYRLFIVSNCQEGYIETFLGFNKLDRYFSDSENAGRTKLTKGENIKLIIGRNNLRAAVYVGDTQWDYDAAKFAGIPFIHAKYGFGTAPEARYHANDIREIPLIADRLLEKADSPNL